MGRARLIAIVVVSSLLATACGRAGAPEAGRFSESLATAGSSVPPSSEAPAPDTTGTSTPPPTAAGGFDPSICDRDNTDDCTVMALVFDDPMPLDQALGQTDDWLAIAVFRRDRMCVPGITFSPEQPPPVSSWFAYVDAEGIRPRVLGNPGTPPITGGYIYRSYWDHFEAEWRRTKSENALITAVVVHTPRGTTLEDVAMPGVVETVEVDYYRRDVSDPAFPGELYIRDHRVPDEFAIDRSNPTAMYDID